jgi:hypothetical protein
MLKHVSRGRPIAALVTVIGVSGSTMSPSDPRTAQENSRLANKATFK